MSAWYAHGVVAGGPGPDRVPFVFLSNRLGVMDALPDQPASAFGTRSTTR